MMQKWAVFLVKTTHFYSAKQLPCIEHIVICLWADIADHIKQQTMTTEARINGSEDKKRAARIHFEKPDGTEYTNLAIKRS